MIKSLSISNYALIESLEIEFTKGFSVITGETGAGKSILLGALSLIVGNRADTSVLNNKEKKCVVEVNFDIEKYSLKSFFSDNEIDYEDITIIRREIAPSGRSRAFVNDTPVNLPLLKDIGSKLTDIHSQHQNLELNDYNFQIKVVDAFSKSNNLLESYKNQHINLKKSRKEYKILTEKADKSKQDFDYFQFLFEELDNAKLEENEQEMLEAELKQLNNTEDIKQNLSNAFSLLSENETCAVNALKDSVNSLINIKDYFNIADDLSVRLKSAMIEVEDIANEIEKSAENITFDPKRIEIVNNRLDLIYTLQNKHNVSCISELIELKDNFQTKLNEITSFGSLIKNLKEKLKAEENSLSEISDKISEKRKQNIPEIESGIIDLLTKLGMPAAKFSILLQKTEDFTESGRDIIKFLFSANKNSEAQEISKIASGGEISRLMLSIKSVIADSIALPGIIFDEIDTGISGDIADKTANIMKEMSGNMQVINITHLPQVAAKADNHYLIYKTEEADKTVTKIKLLNKNEQINEIAKMLSGETVTQAAVENARELLM